MSLKSICASLNVKLCEKGTGTGRGEMRRGEGKGGEGGKGTPCVSFTFSLE